MQVKTVVLENIRQHEERKFSFAPGVNLIYGENGKGKSTIIESIAFALFDYLPITQGDFVRRGQKSGSITVYFEHSGRQWRVDRGVGSSSKFEVFERQAMDWVQVAHGKGQCMARLHEALGLDGDIDLSRLARDALIPPQGELCAGFSLPETGRIDYFTPVLELDRYRRAWRALHDPLVEISHELTLCRGMLKALAHGEGGLSLPEADARLVQVRGDLAEAEQVEIALSDRVASLTKEIGVLETQWNAAEEKRFRLGSHQERITVLNSKIETLLGYETDLEALPGLEAEKAGIELREDFQEEITRAGLQSRHLGTELANIREKLRGARQDYQSAQKLVADGIEADGQLFDVEAALKLAEQKYQNANEESAIQSTAFQEHSEALELIKPGQPCPVCGELLTAEAAQRRHADLTVAKEQAEAAMMKAMCLVDELPIKIGQFKSKIRALRATITRAEGHDLEAAQRVIADLEQQEARLSIRVKDAQELHAELVSQVEVEQSKKKRLQRIVTQIQDLAIKQVQVSELSGIYDERAFIQSKIDALKVQLADAPTEADCNRVLGELGKGRESLSQRQAQIGALRQEQTDLERKIEIINQANDMRANIAKLEEAETLMGRCRQAINDIGPKVADQVMIHVGALAGQYWRDVGKLGTLGWDGTFLVTIDGLDFKPQLSGGMKVIAALACRLAIAQYRADLGLMILDEPTIHLDDPSKHGLAEVIGALGLEQIIIVSHDDTFTASAQNVIEV